VASIPAPKRRRKKTFNLDSKRRREIERLARHVGAADTEDFDRYLIAWHWHNPQSTDPIWSLMNAARNMGGSIAEAKASAITEEASIMRQWRKADTLGRFLGLLHRDRKPLGITTIAGKDVGKRSRTILRKRHARVCQEKRRRAAGVRPRDEYLAGCLTATKPWEDEGVTRRTWERRRNKALSQVRAQHSFLLVRTHLRQRSKGGRARLRLEGSKRLSVCRQLVRWLPTDMRHCP
jgi:hypothetical protein